MAHTAEGVSIPSSSATATKSCDLPTCWNWRCRDILLCDAREYGAPYGESYAVPGTLRIWIHEITPLAGRLRASARLVTSIWLSPNPVSGKPDCFASVNFFH
ncbi:predicted protein [Verticillium alfalfae VaMs.102]|uniref:Predicted protein n=1 Tax=Verticillium alfalfae (strain VaMs.102 / ATCC MYA-4576 / FGSC 10136) TaxID=526221 RepID=C9S8R5_VERA1|nr:predicted protein [Verticillium alfalfae VaMs.102]EEY15365.1 predicted protein [Verticillium alfalfae VaMs.102]